MYQDLLENLNYIEGLYIYGSGEMDQLSPLKEATKNEKDIYQTSVPRKIPLHFIRDTETIKSIQCGELYTIILSTEGNVYTFGCADDGTLGHEESISAKRVPLRFPAIGISGGDCHGIAYNRENLAFWGRFRNKNGGIGEACHEPTYFNNTHINKEYYKKAISGANHVLLLTEKKNVYAFGNNDSGQTGVSPGKRFHHLQMNKLYEKNVEDIFTGDEYSFLTKYENRTKILKSWGANGNGQLGIGSYQTNIKENVSIYVPTKVLFPGITTVSVKKVCGGSGTSICITEDNRVFVWGLNDFSQLGLKIEEKVIPRPKEIEFFNPYTNPDNTVDEVYARNQYFYAKNSTLNKVYSWGMGDCFVLGNRKEKSEQSPYLVNHLFYKNLYVSDLALGSAHVVALLIEKKEMNQDINMNMNMNKS
jgi:regulator of chromosome condensation